MKSTKRRQSFCITVIVVGSFVAGLPALRAQQPSPQAQPQATTAAAVPAEAEAAPKIPNDQLDSLVAPIALYPDPLLAQVLAASTYPLEVIQLEQWLKRNPNLKQDALAEAVGKQTWDPSVQSLAIYPDVVTRLSENVAWTTDLGNAFLAQQSDVMSAVQRMRAKAQTKGTLKTSEQQKVETETVEGGEQVITIEPANPQYTYVPSYDPAVVYGPPIYPYPPYYYPGYVPGMGLAFGTGIILGAAWANHWGNCNWHGGGDVTINNKNNFNKNNINNINRGGQNGKWQHNAQHRGGAPYGDRGTANKYGGRARQQPAGGAGNRAGGSGGLAGNRPGGGSGIAGGSRPGGAARPGGGGGIGPGGIGPSYPGGGPGGGNLGGGNRQGAGAGGIRPSGATRPSGGANSIGNRAVSSGGGFGSSNSVFGSGGYSGGSARSASSRGGSSMGGGGFGGGGGGFSRGGGGGMRGGGGGMRGGGGGRRR